MHSDWRKLMFYYSVKTWEGVVSILSYYGDWVALV